MEDFKPTTETAPAESINGFEDLHPRQVTHNTWNVLSLRNDDVTVHRVDVDDLECDCRDQRMNKGDPEVCDHVAVAVFQSPKTVQLEKTVLTDLAREMSTIERAADQLEDATDAAEGLLVNGRDADAGATPSDPADDSTDDITAALKAALQDAGVDPSGVDMWIDDDFGSLQFEADDMPQGDFDRFRSFCQDIDWINWDRDEKRNYVKPDDFGRVQ